MDKSIGCAILQIACGRALLRLFFPSFIRFLLLLI